MATKTIEKFMIGDRIVQRNKRGRPAQSVFLPLEATITNIYWRDGEDGEKHMVYELDGKPCGWIYEWNWLYA